jgi:hypothetical protein
MKTMKNIFVPLTKVDAEQRLVYGTAAVEQLDKSGEIFDYTTSKPLFEKWSADINALSLPAVQAFGESARSHGNLREMHGKLAAGKLAQPLGFDDLNKTIQVCAKVTDDKAWAKVQDGVYTGFSIGGDYDKIWEDTVIKHGTRAAKRYTAQPTELSLVDNPCMPGATFSVVKADGSEELRKFTTVELGVEDIPRALYKVCEGLASVASPDAVKSDVAGEHSRALRVLKRAKELKVDASGFAKAYVQMYGGEAGQKVMAKGIYDIQDLAGIVCNLNYCRQSLEMEAEYEGDGSEIPMRLKEAVQLLSSILVDLATEETSELTAAKAASNTIGKDVSKMKLFFTTHGAAIEKAAGDATNPELQKMATHLKEIGKHVDGIQKAHDSMGEHLDALNPKEDDEANTAEDAEKVAKTTLKKVFAGELDELKKMNAETSAQVKNLTEAMTTFLKSTPAPSKVALNNQVIHKVADGTVAPAVVDPKDPDAAFKVMKGIHAAGGQPMYK